MRKKKKESGMDQLLSQAESTIRRNRVILFGVIVLIELVLIGISLALKWFSVSEFIVDIINNIIGILPPMLLFDYFYEKISSDASSIEMSKKITSTMMGQPETLQLFNIEDRKKFLRSTVNSVISDPDLTDMILDNANRYVIDPAELNIRIRKEFSYSFELDEDLPEDYSVIFSDPEKAAERYYFVQEILNYTAKKFQPDADEIIPEVSIAFSFDNEGLDRILRDKISSNGEMEQETKGFYVFRENLDLDLEHVRKLVEYLDTEKEERIRRFSNLLRLSLRINGRIVSPEDVIVKEKGIICNYRLDEKLCTGDYSVRVIFSMPKRWGSVIEVAMVDPTYAPKVTLSYSRDKMHVDMYSFLNKSDNTALDKAHEQLNGVFDISLDEWVYPISGMIFIVDKKETA